MATTVTLKNLTKRPLVLNLPRAAVPEAAVTVAVAVARHDARPVRKPKDSAGAGGRSVRAEHRLVSGSVTLLASGTPGDSTEAPRSALQAPDVRAALTARPPRLKIVEAPKAAPEVAVKPAERKREKSEKKVVTDNG